jgi:hypothetical protein
MPMSDKDRINAKNLVDKHLLPKIGSAIHDNSPLMPFQKDRCPESLVTRVGGSTCPASAADDWHAL